MFESEETVTCDVCNLSNNLNKYDSSTFCRGCDRKLQKYQSGKRLVETKCSEKNHLHCVDDDETTVPCYYCREFFVVDTKTVVSIQNGQKVYGSEKHSGFVKRRMDELKEEKKKLEQAEKELTSKGQKIPVVKVKLAGINKNHSKSFPWTTMTTNCDGCGREGTIPLGVHVKSCGWDKCTTKMICRPTRPGTKYVTLKCCETWHLAVREKDLFVKPRCCKQEFAIDTIHGKVLNDQPFYETVPSSSFIKRLVQELYDTRRKVEAVTKELEKHSKKSEKSSFFQRVFQKSKEVTKKVVEEKTLDEEKKEMKKPLDHHQNEENKDETKE